MRTIGQFVAPGVLSGALIAIGGVATAPGGSVASQSPTPTPEWSSVVLHAVADTTVGQSAPDANYGTSDDLEIGYVAREEVQSLLRFDLAAVPRSSRIYKAWLSLYMTAYRDSVIDRYNPYVPGVPPDMSVRIFAAEGPWQEESVTWATRPGVAPGGSFGVLYLPSARFGGQWLFHRYDVNIAELAQRWHSGQLANHGIVLVGPDPTADPERASRTRDVGSRERSSARRPLLYVDYTFGRVPTDTPTPTPSATPTETSTPTETATPSATPFPPAVLPVLVRAATMRTTAR